MANGFRPLLRYLHRVAAGTTGGELSDAQLLERFVRQQDEAAFTVLFQRHARMVWNVCARVLGNSHQAEDAFQSTFLVLVRKAGSIVPRERLPNWLYGVAFRVAKKASIQAAKRLAHHKELSDMSRQAPAGTAGWQELSAVLDEEVRRLPGKYREPLVLCYLEGMGTEEAARQLGCLEGTLSVWLTRAREKLRQRLQRRGMVVPAAALASLLAENAASAAVPPVIADSTLSLTHAFLTTGQLGWASASVVTLTEGVLKDMVLIKLKIAAGILAAAVILAGSGWAVQQALADKPPELVAQEKEKPAGEKKPLPTKLDRLKPETFTAVHQMIRPNPGESRWREIPWLTSTWEARKKAAAEGKPIFITYGGGGAIIGGC